MNILIVFLLTFFSGMLAAFNTAIMRSDIGSLRRKVKLGDPDAKRIYHVRKRGLVVNATLILLAVVLNAALSVYLAQFLWAPLALGLSIGIIFIFGEMIPQAFAGRYTMGLGARGAWLVHGLTILLYPIVFPIAWIVQKIIGKETSETLSKQEIAENIKEHMSDDFEKGEQLTPSEQQIATGALTFGEMTVEQIMTPRKHVISIFQDTLLDTARIQTLSETGHSRFPVLDETEAVVGILVLKDIATSPLPVSVSKMLHTNVMHVHTTDSLEHVFMRGLSQKIRLFPVLNSLDRFVGVITFEDIFEQMTGFELPDEK